MRPYLWNDNFLSSTFLPQSSVSKALDTNRIAYRQLLAKYHSVLIEWKESMVLSLWSVPSLAAYSWKGWQCMEQLTKRISQVSTQQAFSTSISKLYVDNIYFSKALCIITIFYFFHKILVFSAFRAADLLQPLLTTSGLHALTPWSAAHLWYGPVSWMWQWWCMSKHHVSAQRHVVSTMAKVTGWHHMSTIRRQLSPPKRGDWTRIFITVSPSINAFKKNYR